MKLKDRARALRLQADAKTAEASTKWDELVGAREALGSVEAEDLTDVPEFSTAQAAKAAYETAATEARAAEDAYKGVLELMGTEAPEGRDPRITRPQPAGEAPSASIGEAFTTSDVFRNVSARIPATAGSKLAIGTTESVPVATRDQARAILRGRNPQGAIFSTPPDVVEPDARPGIRPLPLLPPLTVLDLITMATTDSTQVKWVRENVFTNAAAEVDESTAGDEITKPEAALTLEPVTFDVTTIAHWMPASKQSLRDVAGVKSLIDAKLEWGLRRRLAKQVINGDGIGPNLLGICNTPGIGHVDRPLVFGAEAFIESIYDGVVTIGDAYGETPNVCFVSRADYKVLRFARDDSGFEAGTGGFIFGTPRGGINPIEVENCLVLPNFDLPDGTSMMGIWREFAVWMHEGITIGMSDSHADFYIKNLVAILAEFSAAAGAMETVAFCEISAA
ncbi:MAG TPA: phage major capsid protein [Thermoleophilia bacterium]